MKKVLLISPNREKRFGALPPLGAACVTAALREKGHWVKLLDLCFTEDIAGRVQKELEDFRPDIIGISVRNIDNTLYLSPRFYLDTVKAVVQQCRQHSDAPVILGGSGFSLLPESIMRFCDVPFGIVGEGEVAFSQVLDVLEKGKKKSLKGIPGLATLQEGEFDCQLPRRITALDEQPLPARDIFDTMYSSAKDYTPTGSLESKRGCSFRCSYCTYPSIQGTPVRLFSPRRVAADMQSIAEEGRFPYVEFVDNVFNYPLDHTKAVCHELIEEKNRLPWGCCLHPAFVSPDLLDTMVNAGCCRVELGADSASPSMLERLSKGFSLDDLETAIKLCQERSLDMGVYILLGGPGETLHTVEESLANLDKMNPTNVYFMYGIRLFPGTYLWDTAFLEGIVSPGEDPVEPIFYLSNGMDKKVFEMVNSAIQSHPGWILMGAGNANGSTPAQGVEP